MIRFRQLEDERRYLQLRTDLYLRVARLPPQFVSEAMRAFGKLEQLVHLEGIRQGLAVAELSLRAEAAGVPDVRNLKAFQAHSMVYGSQDTPLADVEQERLGALNLSEVTADAAWLDALPMRYAPQTLAEWEAEQNEVEQDVPLPALDSLDLYDEDEPEGDDPELENLFLRIDADSVPEEPAYLDRVRDELQTMRSKGWNPQTWQQLIMDLHLATHTDAAFLDLQLSTQMGMTVLAQSGIHLQPGMVFLNELAPTAQPEEQERDGTGTAEDGGAKPNG